MFKYIKNKWLTSEISINRHEENIVLGSNCAGFTFMHVMTAEQAKELIEHLKEALTEKETA